MRWLLGICVFLVSKNKIKSRKKSTKGDQKSEEGDRKSADGEGRRWLATWRAPWARGLSYIGRTCAFVRTVRGFWKCKVWRGKELRGEKWGREIANKRRTVRAGMGLTGIYGVE